MTAPVSITFTDCTSAELYSLAAECKSCSLSRRLTARAMTLQGWLSQRHCRGCSVTSSNAGSKKVPALAFSRRALSTGKSASVLLLSNNPVDLYRLLEMARPCQIVGQLHAKPCLGR